MTGYILSIVFLLVALVVVALMWRRDVRSYGRTIEERDTILSRRAEDVAQRDMLVAQRDRELSEERIAHARTQSERDALKSSIEDMRQDRESSESSLKLEFKNLANEILAEHQHNLL